VKVIQAYFDYLIFVSARKNVFIIITSYCAFNTVQIVNRTWKMN